MKLSNLSQNKLLLLMLLVPALIGALAWFFGRSIESPAEIAARAQPPEPSLLLAPVEERVLSSKIVTRGTARFGLPQPVTIAPSLLKPDVGLIATVPTVNTQVEEGDVIITASGRPVFVLQGKFPAYRDMRPGDRGQDVRQLSSALIRLGHFNGEATEVYTTALGDAVASFYTAEGYEPFGPTEPQTVKLNDLRHAANEAQKLLVAAEALVDRSNLAVEAAHAAATERRHLAAAETATRNSERESAEANRQRTEARLTLAANAARRGTEGDRAALARAQQDLTAAEEGVTTADARIAAAEAGEKAASLDAERIIREAEDAVALAKLDVDLARDRSERLAEQLVDFEGRYGMQVPADEVVFLPSLPVRVEEITAKIGDQARGQVVTVTDNRLSVDGALTLETATLVRPGMDVQVDERALGLSATGKIAYVAPTPGTRGVDGYHIYFEVAMDEVAVPLQGYSLRLTIPIESTGDAVTVVPVNALTMNADGRSSVQIVDASGGAPRQVYVEPGLSADGYVEVKTSGEALSTDQSVVIGYELRTQNAGGA